MKIVVCIKQVPASTNVAVDPNTGVLIRDGNNTKMNPYDLYALETALRIKEQTGAFITVITMGPPSSTTILYESLWMGCDEALLISDRAFAGADVVATAYTLFQAISKLGKIDLVICGKQTTDGDTGQVGPEIAEYLNIPHVAYIDKIIELKTDSIIMQANMEKTKEIYEVNFPCLITVEKGIYAPRLPSYKRSLELKDYKIASFTLNSFVDNDPNHYGLNGSPTQVEKIFSPNKNKSRQIFEGSGKEMAEVIFEKLKEVKML